ncbi:MAG: regulatory protein RecX [Candidatus Dormibacteria bacterium]
MILNAAAQSAEGLRRRLVRGGFLPVAVDEVVARMRNYGYVDDLAFAQGVSARRQREGRGRIVVIQELRRKGVSAEVIDDALGQGDASSEAAAAIAAARRLLRRHDGGDGADRRRKMLLALARRGFSYAVADSALRSLESGSDAEN